MYKKVSVGTELGGLHFLKMQQKQDKQESFSNEFQPPSWQVMCRQTDMTESFRSPLSTYASGKNAKYVCMIYAMHRIILNTMTQTRFYSIVDISNAHKQMNWAKYNSSKNNNKWQVNNGR